MAFLCFRFRLRLQAQHSLTVNSSVEVEVAGADLIVRTGEATWGQRSPRFKLSELLADYDPYTA